MFVSNNHVNEKLAKSLTADTVDLIPFLPYLLQDLWELGSDPKDIITLIQKNISSSAPFNILDLACGKGAVCIKVAEALNTTIKGIDIVPEFIKYATDKAQEYGMSSLCQFVVDDINHTTSLKQNFDCVILGAVGDVLGSPEITLEKLKNTIKKTGYIILADAYLKADERYTLNDSENDYYTNQQWNNMFEDAGLEVVDSIVDSEISDINDFNTRCIINRANELIQTYPEYTKIFESYIQSQELECEDLENILVGITWLLKVKI